jgi:hypothetical protein
VNGKRQKTQGMAQSGKKLIAERTKGDKETETEERGL